MSALNSDSYSLSEEIVRWRVEVSVRNSKQFWTAFSNPTAGPWKFVEGYDDTGKRGEVHRFARDDKRPDLIVVCDSARAVLIFEAKDKITKLATQRQIVQSAGVIRRLGIVLEGKERSPYWGVRAHYTVIPGIIWGTVSQPGDGEFTSVASRWMEHLDSDGLLGIAVIQERSGALRCKFSWYGIKVRDLPPF